MVARPCGQGKIFLCFNHFLSNVSVSFRPISGCPAVHDGVLCWPPTPVNLSRSISCSSAFETVLDSQTTIHLSNDGETKTKFICVIEDVGQRKGYSDLFLSF